MPSYGFHHLTLASLFILAIGVFTSISFSALSHVLLFFPALYFTFRDFHWKGPSKSWWALAFIVVTIVISVLGNWGQMHGPIKNLLKIKYFLAGLFGVFAYQAVLGHGHGHSHSLNNDKKIKLLLHLFLIVTTLATLIGLVALFTGINPISGGPPCNPSRACGLFHMLMTYGYGIGLFLIPLTGMLLYRRELSRWIDVRFTMAVWSLNVLGLTFSFCRGAWLGFALALPFFFIKKNRRKFIQTSLGILLLGILAISFSSKVQKTFMSSERIESNLLRLSLFEASWMAFKEDPWIGKGYRNFEPQSRRIKSDYGLPFDSFGGHAHNNFLEHLASTGLPGFIALLLFHLFWLLEMYRRDDLIARLTFPFVIGFTISGQFQYTFGDGENLFFIMAVWAFSQGKYTTIKVYK